MITWRPHTEAPTEPVSALICCRVGSLIPPEGRPMVQAELYNWHPHHGWRGEITGLPLVGEYWWVPDEEITGEPMREATRLRNIGERVVLPIVIAFACGVLAMDVASEGQRIGQLEDMRVAVTRQLQIEAQPLFCPTIAEASK